MQTLLPFLIALALLAVGGATYVGPFALALLLVALCLWGIWRVTAGVLAGRGENVFRLAETRELLGRGGPDDPDFMLVPRRRHRTEDEAPAHADAAGTMEGSSGASGRGMIAPYLSLSDEQLEGMATDRATRRNASFSIEERPSGTFSAAFTVPSPIEDGDTILLSAEGHDRKRALCALLWLDDQTPQGFGYAV